MSLGVSASRCRPITFPPIYFSYIAGTTRTKRNPKCTFPAPPTRHPRIPRRHQRLSATRLNRAGIESGGAGKAVAGAARRLPARIAYARGKTASTAAGFRTPQGIECDEGFPFERSTQAGRHPQILRRRPISMTTCTSARGARGRGARCRSPIPPSGRSSPAWSRGRATIRASSAALKTASSAAAARRRGACPGISSAPPSTARRL